MFIVEFRIGKYEGQKRTYTTARRSLGSIFNSIPNLMLYHKIREWMTKAEDKKRATNLTVESTIRIEYTP